MSRADLKPAFRERALTAIRIEPRCVADLAARFGSSESTMRKVVRGLRDDRLVYISYWGIAHHNPVAFYAEGAKQDAPTPDATWNRIAASAKRHGKAAGADLRESFNHAKPVACYGFWGMP